MSTVLFPPDPQYQGRGGAAQPQPPHQRGFFESLFSGFGIFSQTPPAYQSPPPPATPQPGPGLSTAPPQLQPGAGVPPTSPPQQVQARTGSMWSIEIGCPHMDGKTLTKKGKPVEVPFPAWATKYRADFSPVYPGPDAPGSQPPDYDHPLSAFAFGLSEPARGVMSTAPGEVRPASFTLTPHWLQSSGNNSKADTIKAVLTVYFE